MKDEKILALLSRREKEVVDLLLQGGSNKQIALALGISERTVEFHLKNVYVKLQVASRVELILKLGQTAGGNLGNPVESTVEIGEESLDNGNQPIRSRAAKSMRNTVSLIKKEVAMTIQISFEDLENYLRSRPLVFSLLLLLTASLTARYVVFDLGLYLWASYILLGVFLGVGSIYLGKSWKRVTAGEFHFQPLFVLAMSALLPLIAAGFDQLYMNTVLRYTDPISISIANISASAQWLTSADGGMYRSTHLSVKSDVLWFIVIAEMLVMFLLSCVLEKRSTHLATA